ncbi:MAG: uncharacterized protein KVP18_001238 [Porospora cf. gigantea A]|nr:MAG: hypothetical protein KVP18_001238 [Porospora cf. gigantea A]
MKRPVGRPPSRPHPRHGWPPFGVPFPTPLADPRARLQVPASQLHFTSVGGAGQYQPSVPPPAQSSADGSLEPDQKLGPAESCFYSAVGAQYQEQKKPGNPPSDVQRQYPVSPLFKGGLRLFDHQLEGLNWLLDLWSSGRNGILADEMGLGKTIQAMAFMWHLHTKERLRGPFLVVAPLSTVYHWQQTAEAWTDMNCVLYYDEFGKGGRDAIRAHEWCHHALSDVRNGRVGQDTVTRQYQLTETSHYKFHLLVTSYETFMVDNDILAQMPWQYVVLDEAHKLKNRLSKLLLTLRLIACRDILLLTGTFVQNNTEEMWPLLNLVEPVKFCDVELFKQQFGDLQTPEQVGILNKVLRQHLLRRVKEDVAHSIPPLEETIIDVELTILQKAWYRAILEKNLDVLSRMGNSKGPRLMNIEVELRKCCNHPFMLAGVEEREYASCRSAEERLKRFVEASGKMVLLNKLLPKLKDEDHKVLIFSQFNSCLNLIEEFILCRGWKYERIDGSIKGQNRTQAIRRFNDPNHERFVFLLSTRAGGLGINLTSADHVIIFDSDWNPQNDIQATARAHRIGQEKEVKVYRLITTRTYEAEMFARASRKLGLNTAVFHRGAFGGEGPSPREITPNCREIENLLKKGAYYLLDSQASQEFQESNISDILSKKTRLVRYQLCGGSSTFAKTSFKSDQTGDIPIDDPDFWKKLLAESSNRQLLSRLNDGSATRDDNAKRKFMRALEDAVDTIAVGAPADSDADCVLEALVQVQHLRDFCREDRELAEQWLQQASRALESLREKVEPESDQAADPQTSQSARKRTRLTTRDDEEFRCSDDGSEEREPVTKRKRRRRQKRVR